MKLPFDKVVVSSDDSPVFLNFWPIVCASWKKYFGITPTLAFVSNRDENDHLVRRLKSCGEVVLVPEVENIPRANQAKIARFYVASKLKDQVCLIEDIDTVPLKPDYVLDRLSKRESGKILAIGREIHVEPGKFPISNVTSEGENFAKLFNPHELGFKEFVESLIGLKVFDRKEDPSNSPDRFSDESLIRALVKINNVEDLMQHIDRNSDPMVDWIDRSWWRIDEERLRNNSYTSCNFIRPFKENAYTALPVIYHIFGGLPVPEELFII